jgi:RimJ/RimL family protein N-acetyltransferase
MIDRHGKSAKEATMTTQERPTLTIEGHQIALGPLRRDLIPHYARWQGDILVQRTYRTPGPVTIDEATAWYERCSDATGDSWFTIYERATWRPIGYTEVDGIDWRCGTGGFGILIGEADCRGRGYGTEITRLMLDFAFTALGLRNVMLTTDSFNLAAQHAYRNAGFKEIGRRRQCSILNGQFHDLVFMDCLASEFTSPLLAHIFVPDTPRP